MKVKLKTKELFTDEGRLIKKLDCKYNVTKQDLVDFKDRSMIGHCPHCWKGIIKTENLSDSDMVNEVNRNPDICFFVDLKQKNITHIDRGESLYFKNLKGICSIECNDCGSVTEELTLSTRMIQNNYHQCKSCGELYTSANNICCVESVLSNDSVIFCKDCKSTNLFIASQMIG